MLVWGLYKLLMSHHTKPKRKEAQTIDQVLQQLDEIVDTSINQEDYFFLFTYVYRETTAEIKNAIQNKRFENPARMEKMDVVFANLFINAYYEHQISQPIASCWKVAFESRKEKLAFVQHILLGMNAHINLDLAVAASMVSPGNDIITLKNDFMVVNQILAELTNKIQMRLGRVSFFMKLLDIFGFRNDEKIIDFSISKARDFAWINAMELALLEKEQALIRQAEIDIRVLEISKLIKNPPGKFLTLALKIISLFENRDPKRIIKKLKQE